MLVNVLFASIYLYIYAAAYWFGSANLAADEWLVSVHYAKPWVYRQLVPLLARGLMGLGMRVDVAITTVVILSGLAYFFALRSLLFNFRKTSEFVPLILFLSSIIMFQYRRMNYDMMTAFLCTLAFYYLFNDKPRSFLWLFPLMCLNRETAILFPVAFWLIRRDRLALVVQVLIWGMIEYGLHNYFSDNIGSSVWIRPIQNLTIFLHYPLYTFLHLLLFGAIGWMITRNWKEQDKRVRVLFILFAPVFLMMYLFLGYAYEIRVLIEIYPLVVILSSSNWQAANSLTGLYRAWGNHSSRAQPDRIHVRVDNPPLCYYFLPP